MDISTSNSQILQNQIILSNLTDDRLEVLKFGTNGNYLDTLSTIALNPRYTSVVFVTHKDVFVEICSRWLKNLPSNRDEDSVSILAALARILPGAPYLAVYVKEILLRRKPGRLQVFASRRVTALIELPYETLHSLLLALYRLLRFDNEAFATIISPAQLQCLLKHSYQHIRLLAIRLLCLYLHASDSAMEQMLKKFCSEHKIAGEWEDRMIDYAFLTLWEEKRVKQLIQELENHQSHSKNQENVLSISRRLAKEDLSHTTACVGNVLIPRLAGEPADISSIVNTDTGNYNMRLFANAMNTENPLLITGLSGSGKTFLINEFARELGTSQSIVSLHLNEQTDIKMLIGMHTNADTPGSFTWKPGVLTKAVMEGHWLLIEDLNRAPTEVLSALLPLLERRELFVPHWGESVQAASGFKIFATIRSKTNERGEEMVPGIGILGIRNWFRVPLMMLTNEELHKTLIIKFPIIHAHVPNIMDIYSKLSHSRLSKSSNEKPRIVEDEHLKPQILFRLCRRLNDLMLTAGIVSGDEPISETLHDIIFIEAIDCFAGFLPEGSIKSYIVDTVSQKLNIHPDRAHFCLKIRSPDYTIDDTRLRIGRTNILRSRLQGAKYSTERSRKIPFAMTSPVLRVLESVAVAIKMAEPCLLVGETGTGKTTLIQHLADTLGCRLIVVNLSQQSEASDLLGGFKPLNLRALAIPLKEEFEDLFRSTFSSKRNQDYIDTIGKAVARSRWSRALTLWQEALQMAKKSLNTSDFLSGLQLAERRPKKRKLDSFNYQELVCRWDKFSSDLQNFYTHVSGSTRGSFISFVEGNIVQAVRRGYWVLLDEINLASPDALECLADLFCDGLDNTPTLMLSEKGAAERIYAHKDFRIFGAMNPATDIGKRDLPTSLRSRFTEIYIDSPDRHLEDLIMVVNAYLGSCVNTSVGTSSRIAQLYLKIKQLVNENRIVDGTNHKPHFSLRTLTRTLVYVTDLISTYGLHRALYEGFSMTFLTVLNKTSELLVLPLIEQQFLASLGNSRIFSSRPPQSLRDSKKHVKFGQYWIAQGDAAIKAQPHYVITPFVEQNLLKLVRATATRRYPLLLQGPTSSGKTSMIEYLAHISGNTFVRINNHEHTDIQEYLGSYVSGIDGRLEYEEGILIRALREGYWLVLDELNLAPTDVLEALNRLLDDNRELFVPETQLVIRPHDNFVLFATQNPPGMYGGRKILSRAFRNRFLELHFDDIPEDELEIILQERSQIAPSFCSKIVTVYKQLSILRQKDRLFEQRNSFATLRDLFRWALRDADNREQLAVNGFFLLAERIRNSDERLAVKNIIQDVMRLKLDENDLYSHDSPLLPLGVGQSWSQSIVWTRSMRRLCVLVTQALQRNEPVLLVGETGSGKTTVCQIVAELLCTKLHIVNGHQNMETGDLIGAQRPVRNRAQIEAELIQELSTLLMNHGILERGSVRDLPMLLEEYEALLQRKDCSISSESRTRIRKYQTRSKALFEWSDGSLVHAMREGQHFLLDEISLADDSVLERLNSVLEPDRNLFLAEKGSTDTLIMASQGFQFLATMNPGGDYGKRELSPALRNRFTEIWVPQIIDHDEIREIVAAKLPPLFVEYASPMVAFAMWYCTTYSLTASIRNLLSWIQFINICKSADPYFAILHGAAMVYIDGLGVNPSAKISMSEFEIPGQRRDCLSKLGEFFQHDMFSLYNQNHDLSYENNTLRIGTFKIDISNASLQNLSYNLENPTTKKNAMKIARALQLPKPVLLEGNPGVGKTTLVVALAQATGNTLTRINLSEQTDLMDLFGSDVPIEEADAGHFGWRDAPFLQAMQNGDWVLLDEMNLASQAVLEGLNACFDHRGQVYVSELNKTFAKHPNFTVFAAQNPHHQGGGRKGLPASFVDRFTIVYADAFTSDDLLIISSQSYSGSSLETTKSLVNCVSETGRLLQKHCRSGTHGGPWEINLRDLLRWGKLLSPRGSTLGAGAPADYQDILFLQRFRTSEDIEIVSQPFKRYLIQNQKVPGSFHNTNSSYVQVGNALVARNPFSQPILDQHKRSINCNLRVVESALFSIQNSWPCLLVGRSGCGKSSLLFQIASKVGADIVNLSLNADTDTMDLIGGYEQVNIERDNVHILKRLKKAMHTQITQKLVSSSENDVAFASLEEEVRSTTAEQQEIQKLIYKLKKDDQSPDLIDVFDECEHLNRRSLDDNRGRFEWIDGILIKALKKGQWLVLDNANLCPSAVLDRLNSLLEPNGLLIVNEHLSLDENAYIVKPHPNFRLFLTMDPRHGELSRSMRNRCVELFMQMPPISSQANSFSSMYEPSVSRFQLFSNIDWSASDSCSLGILMSIFFDHLTVADYQLAHRWQGEILKGLVEIPKHIQEILLLDMKVRKEMTDSRVVTIQNLRRIYNQISTILGTRPQFESMLTINPLINPHIISLATRHNLPDLKLLGLRFELILDIYKLISKLSVSSKGAQSKSMLQMSRLERSYSASKSHGFRIESTQPLWKFLQDVAQFVLSFVDGDHSGELNGKDNTIRFSRIILSYLGDIIDISTRLDFEEAIFQTYLAIGRSIAAYGNENLELRRLADELSTRLSVFSTSWQLRTGLSMEILCKSFQPPMAKSFAQLEHRFQAEALADRFDKLKWKLGVSIQELDSFRSSMILFESKIDSLKVYGDGLFKDIQTSFAEFENRLNPFNFANVPHFTKQFEIMCQYEVAINFKEVLKPLSVLELLANRPIRRSIGVDDFSGVWRSAYQIEGLTGISEPSTFLATLRNIFPPSMLSAMEKISDVPLRCLASLRDEMNVMARNTMRLSESISTNNLFNLNANLARIFVVICEAHRELLDPSSLENCLAYLNRYENTSTLNRSTNHAPSLSMKRGGPKSHYFSPTIENYLNPSLLSLCKVTNQQIEAFTATSAAWIQFFTGCLYLYVPDKPFDPAIKPKIEKDRYEKRRIELQTKLQALQKFELLFTGQDSSLQYQIVEQQLLELGNEPQVPFVIRPQVSELSQLQGEFENVLKIIAARAPSASDLELLFRGDPIKIQESELLRLNIAQSIARITNRFRFYDDMTKPLVAMLQGLDTGLALALLAGSPTSPQSNIAKHICESTPFLGMCPAYFQTTRLHSIEKYQTQGVDSRYFFLKVAALSQSVNRKIGQPLTRLILEVFRSFYEDWKAVLQTDQQQNITKSSMYRYRGAEEDVAAEDIEELSELFPDYSATSMNVDDAKGARYDQKALTLLVASHHKAIFKNLNCTSDQILDMLHHSSSIIGKSWPGESSTIKYDISAERMMCGVVLSLNKHQNELNILSTNSQNSNFYFDPNITEAQKLVSLVRRIQLRFQTIQEAWPEHATIQNILQTSSELMAMRHSEPVAKLLTKAEQLHGFMYEWQLVASKEYSALNTYEQFTTLLVDWRRLELSTWARLLDKEAQNCTDDADSWWFIAYEIIIAAPLSTVRSGENLQSYGEQLFSTLEDFLLTTSVGQFFRRLQLIECFQMHIQILVKEVPALDLLQNALTNCSNYYSRFVKTINENLEKGRKSLDGEMKEILLLASWKDTNINSLRESAKRSHHKLFKIVRKFRALLAQSAEKFITQGLPESSENADLPAYTVAEFRLSDMDRSAFSICQENLPGWASRPTRFIDTLSTAENMARISQIPSIVFNSVLHLDGFVNDLVGSIKQLQKETPTKETKENHQTLKHLKYRKKKLFADTLRSIRRLGFQSSLSNDALARQSSLAKILSNGSAMPVGIVQLNLEAAEFDFYYFLQQMPQVRQQIRSHSIDLNPGDITRCVGLLEVILNHTIRQRGIVMNYVSDLQSLDKTISLMENLRLSEAYTILIEESNGLITKQGVETLIAWLPGVLDAGITIIKKHDELGGLDSSYVIEALKCQKTMIEPLSKVYQTMPEFPPGLSSSLHEQTKSRAVDILADLVACIQDLIKKHPNLKFVLAQIELWTKRDLDYSNEQKQEKIISSIKDFDAGLCDTLDSILVTIQRIKGVIASTSISQEDTKWLVNTDYMLANCIQTLQPQKIVSLLQNSITKIHCLESNNLADVVAARALYVVAMPIIQQYRNIVKNVLDHYAKFHRSFCRLARILAQSFCQIASQGFCSPSDNSTADAGESEKLEEGTGLGEGDGAQDISKDIDADEDLSELAQDTKKEKDISEIEDQEDAVNMDQEELEGDMGDASNGDNDGKSEEEGEEMDIDEETGSVNDLDPSAVDEKLWDGNKKDAEKDKEGAQAKGDRNRNEQVAAKADENEMPNDDSGEEADTVNEEGAEEGEQIAHEQTECIDARVEEDNPLELPDSIDLGNDNISVSESELDDYDLSPGDVSEQQEPCESDSSSQDDKPSDETTEKDETLQSKEDLVEEIGPNTEEAEGADRTGSPVNTEPEDDEAISDQEPLRDHSNDAYTDQDNNFQTIAEGLGKVESQGDEEEEQIGGAQGNSNSNGGALNSESAKSMAEEGQNIQTGQNSKEMQEQGVHPEQSSISQIFKKLGDALEKWHRQQREIQAHHDPSENVKLNPAGPDLGNQEFEHLGDESADADTQALGAASQDQAHALDEKAYESQMQDQLPDFTPDEASIQNLEQEDTLMADFESQVQKENLEGNPGRGAVIIDNVTRGSSLYKSKYEDFTEQEEEIDELDSSLSLTHLNPLTSLNPRPTSDALHLWTHLETITHPLSLILTEQLRLILAPTLATKMRGDFRTGKRLNIKRIIPYIASNYKRDKIWMRRTQPSRRAYQILLAVDDSKSMSERSGSHLAFATLALVAKSLSMLEAGQLCIVGFGTDVHVAHAFQEPFSADTGAALVQHFTFQQPRTDVKKLLQASAALFHAARNDLAAGGGSRDLWQLQLIISDGVCEDHEEIRRLVRRAQEARIVIVFVIVDAAGKGESILDMSQAIFEPEDEEAGGESKLKIKRYLDGFPFPYYLVVGDVKELPDVLATALRQWFAEVVETG